MRSLKKLGIMVVALLGLAAIMGASAASATTLEVGGITQNGAVTITISQQAGTSWILKDEFGTTTDTCTTSDLHLTTVTPFTGAVVKGVVSSRRLEKCTHTTTVLSNGELSFQWTSGTNATVSSSGAEITVLSTFFGASAICKTGAGTHLGTITGVKTGHAIFHTNAKINCGILGSSSWTGTDVVTTPTGLGFEN